MSPTPCSTPGSASHDDRTLCPARLQPSPHPGFESLSGGYARRGDQPGAAGLASGSVDNIIMRVMDILLSFPSLLLAIAVVAMRGPGLTNTMIAIAIVN